MATNENISGDVHTWVNINEAIGASAGDPLVIENLQINDYVHITSSSTQPTGALSTLNAYHTMAPCGMIGSVRVTDSGDDIWWVLISREGQKIQAWLADS